MFFENNFFPDDIKLVKVSSVFQKKYDLGKENYRPVCVLPDVSKVFRRIVYNQIDNFMRDKFSNLFIGLERIIHTALLNAHALNVEEQIGQ